MSGPVSTTDAPYADAARHLTDERLSAVSWVVIAMNAIGETEAGR
jgi:hypothetical protein